MDRAARLTERKGRRTVTISSHIDGQPQGTREERWATAGIVACFLLAGACAAGMIYAYWYTDNIGLMGGLIGVGFVFVAVGLTLWAHHLVPEGPYYEEYPHLPSSPQDEAEALATLDRGGIGRRKLLIGSLGIAGAAIAGGLGSTVDALGPAPASFAGTVWRGRRRLVDQDGKVIRLDELEVGGAVGVFPDGFISEPMVACMLIRLPRGVNHPLSGRVSWTPDQYICYSKICTHAGCAVNMYDKRNYVMMCPCHQSTFRVTRGAAPIFGPAVDPLPQLPLTVEADGVLRSTGDLSHPPGPMYWHYVPGVGT